MGHHLAHQRHGIVHATVRVFAIVATVTFVAVVAAGCGGPDNAAAGEQGEVVLTFADGKDQLGLIDQFMANCTAESNGRYRLEQLVLPPSVDGQREQMIRRLAAEDPSIDILGLDVIWTAEFSRAGWIKDLTDDLAPIKDQYVESVLNTVVYDDKYWAVPFGTNVAMMFYRKDLIDTPPTTWQELVEQSKQVQESNPDMAGLVWQANRYEGFTVDVLEFLHGSGVDILNEDGSASVLAANPQAVETYNFMKMLFDDGITPKAVTTFQEEESRQYFQSGKAVFMRNWPYVWGLMSADKSEVKGKVGIAPLPAWEGGESVAVLGGKNYGVSAFSDAPELATEAAICMASAKHQRINAMEKAELVAFKEIYDDAELNEKYPFYAVGFETLKTARSRPVSPYYNDLTVAIADYSHRMITNKLSTEEGVAKLDEAITLAVNGQGEV